MCIAQAASLLSNSYVVNENIVARACMCVGVVLLWLRACAAQVVAKERDCNTVVDMLRCDRRRSVNAVTYVMTFYYVKRRTAMNT